MPNYVVYGCMPQGLPSSGEVFGPTPQLQPLIAIIGNGQSLSTGDYGTPPLSTSNVGGNLRLFDSSGNYTTSTPNAATLSLVNLVAPMRSDVYTGGGGDASQYPLNIGGESPEIAAANTLATLQGAPCFAASVGQGGQVYTVIKKGGTGNAYAAGIYELTVAKRLTSSQYSLILAFYMLTHGETDATNGNAGYLADLVQMQSDINGDAPGITGQAQTVLLVVSQQNSQPGGSGATVGVGDLPGIAQWQMVQQNPTKAIGVGPKYQYGNSYGAGDGVHLSNAGYQLLGEKAGIAMHDALTGGPGTALIATGATRVGNTVTVTFSVPVLPLIFTTTVLGSTITQPHANATLFGDNGTVFGSGNTGWTAGKGFELWHGGFGGTPIGISSCVISGSTVAITGVSQPDTVAYAHTPDGRLGVGTAIFPDGRCGCLFDSDTRHGASGIVQANPAWEFLIGGL